MNTNIVSTLQSLLYHYPMYQYIASHEKNINILVLGWNDIAKHFVDLALSVGQMAECGLTITVSANEPENNWLDYLKDRPALPGFIYVTTEEEMDPPPQDCYGALHFINATDELSLPNLLARHAFLGANERFHYFFICETDDNRHMADLCAQLRQTDKVSASLIAMIEDHQVLVQDGNSYHTVDSIWDNHGTGLALEDMAFNTHMLWWNASNSDLKEEWDRFRNPNDSYNFLSSRAYALSIRYKLWNVGIETEDQVEAAQKFAQMLQSDDNHIYFRRLLSLERRRWVMEKVAAGYTGVYNNTNGTYEFEQFIEKGSMRIEKKNVCIVHSGESMPLEGPDYQGPDRTRWDIKGDYDKDLDELDLVSVKLHRFMREEATKLRDDHYIDKSDGPVQCLENLILNQEKEARKSEGDRVSVETVNPLRMEYNRFMYCIRSILDGSFAYAKQYSSFRADLIAAFATYCPNSVVIEAKQYLETLSHAFFPAIEANLYRSYKRNDEALIQNIPFILTYKKFSHLALAFDVPRNKADINDHIFNNLASPMMIKPSLILYLYHARRNMQPDLLADMLESCHRFLQRNNIRSKLHLAIHIDTDLPSVKQNQLRSRLRQLKEKQILSSLSLHTDSDTSNFFETQLQEHHIQLYDGTVPLFASAMENAQWVLRISNYGYFETNAATKTFRTTESSRWLNYINDQSVLRVDDMFALMNGENREPHYPDYTELVRAAQGYGTEPLFMRLWNIYTGKLTNWSKEKAISAWNTMCTAFAPENTRNYAKAGSLLKGKLDFAALVNAKSLQGDKLKSAVIILRELAKIETIAGDHLLKLENDHAGNISIILSPRANMAHILSNAGKILEVYAFFQAFETGYFDDIACDYTFYWGDQSLSDSERRNEIDLILTKGFRSIIVECKATAELKQDFYHKLSSLADIFGINTTKVLIANAYSSGSNGRYSETNNQDRIARYQDQIARGQLMDITTLALSTDKEFKHLGNRLVQLMKETE